MSLADDPLDLATYASRANPYPAYAAMRARAPAFHCEAWGTWVVARYADVSAAFRDRRFSSARAGAFASRLSPEMRERLAPLVRNLASWALLTDDPDHARLRGLVNRAFTPRVVEKLRPAIVELAALLVDDALRGEREGALDVLHDLAEPLPVLVIGDLLGLPREDRRLLKKWSDALAAFLGAVRASPAQIQEALAGVVEMEAYFRDVLAARRKNPGDDLISTLLVAEDKGAILSEQELVSTCSMVLFGGHETTTNLIANGVFALLRHPGELARLRADAGLLETAVEELLRFESPVQRMGRITLEDVDVSGVTIPAGSRVFLVLGAAHRDADAFPDPDRLDVAREENRHLALGLGAHYCVGASLGRAEARAAFAELLRRFRTIELRGPEPAWMDNATIRGLDALPIEGRA
jgi:cytochrome P450